MEPLLALLVGVGLGWLIAGPRPRTLPRSEHPSQGLGRLQLLRWIDAAPIGWLILDGADGVQVLNPRAERIFARSGVNSAGPLPLAQLCDSPQLAQVVHLARQRDRSERLEWSFEGQDLEVYAQPGEQGWVAVTLLSRRSLEAQLEQQERWVSDVAHELKTPLTALILVGDTLAAHVTQETAVPVERLQRELLRLQDLVGDLLELSRLENTVPAACTRGERVDLAHLVDQVWEGLRPLAEERNIRLEIQPLAPAGSTAIVPGDGPRLHRALLNLIDNAVRYSPDGGTVRVGFQSGPQWCRVAVRDEGPGLSQEDLEHLFERFYRGDSSRVRSRRGGSGLGLSIVQQIALTHGGHVLAENHPQGGALLEMVVPVKA